MTSGDSKTKFLLLFTDIHGNTGKPAVGIDNYYDNIEIEDGRWQTVIVPLKGIFYNWNVSEGQNGSRIDLDFSNITEISFTPWPETSNTSGIIYLDNLRLVGADQNGNKYPIAVASLDKSQVVPDEPVQLDASKSYDPDGVITTYRWQPDTGLTDPASVQPLFVSHYPGTYVYDLIVKDNKGLSSRNAAQVVIKVQVCSEWEDVISKYMNYLNAQTSWEIMMNCYKAYISRFE